MIKDSSNPFDRLPPHDIDAEMCLLASMMLDAAVREEQAARFSRHDFFGPDNGQLFQVLMEMTQQRKAVDAVLLCRELARRQLLEEVGGQAYIGQILNTIPSAAHASYYAKSVRETSKLRAGLDIAHRAIRRIYAPSADDNADVILGAMAKESERVAAVGTASTIQSIAQAMPGVVRGIIAGTTNRRLTGLFDLDAIAGGLPIGGFTIVAAPPGMGKSQWAKCVARNIAAGVGHPDRSVPVGIVAAEEDVTKILKNYLAGASGIRNSRIIHNRDLTPADHRRIEGASHHLQSLPIFIDDAERQLSRVEATIRRMVREHGCKVIVVDHIHLLDGETREGRTQEVSKLSKALKAVFKELNVCGLVVAQVNRTGDPMDNPELRHLRDSGSLEADGDLIIQFRRRDYVGWKDDPHGYVPDHRLEAFINKNKDGDMGMIELHFDGDSQTISDWNAVMGPNVPDFS